MRLFQKGVGLRRIDVESCAAAIAVLLAGRKLTFQEITGAIEGLNPVSVFPQLCHIEGVMFLKSEPAGLTLTSEFRQELVHSAKTG
jgi:hypothetical protein